MEKINLNVWKRQVRDAGGPAAVRDCVAVGDVHADRAQHVRDPAVGVALGPFADPPAAGARSAPPAHLGPGAQARILHGRFHADRPAAFLLLQSAHLRHGHQRQRHQVSRSTVVSFFLLCLLDVSSSNVLNGLGTISGFLKKI
jgi:hypothetical protein